MNTTVMFSKAADEWETPQELWNELHKEFHFDVDAAASHENTKCEEFHSIGTDALRWPWTFGTYWLNPPYSKCREFIAKASHEVAVNGVTVVCLVPSRTDTRWWHDHVWDASTRTYRPGVEVRFVKGRVTFGFHVTEDMCQVVRSNSSCGEKAIARDVGLPLLVVRGILAGDSDLVVGAPFPSVVIIFRPPHKEA